MYTDKVSNMVFIMTASLERNTLVVVGYQHNSIESETYMIGIAPLQLHFRVPHERILHFQFPHLEKVKKVFERGFSIRRPHNVCGFVLWHKIHQLIAYMWILRLRRTWTHIYSLVCSLVDVGSWMVLMVKSYDSDVVLFLIYWWSGVHLWKLSCWRTHVAIMKLC